MNMHDKLQSAATAVPASVTTASIAGLSLQEWVYVATLLWIGTQLFFFVKDRIKRRRKDERRQEGDGD